MSVKTLIDAALKPTRPGNRPSLTQREQKKILAEAARNPTPETLEAIAQLHAMGRAKDGYSLTPKLDQAFAAFFEEHPPAPEPQAEPVAKKLWWDTEEILARDEHLIGSMELPPRPPQSTVQGTLSRVDAEFWLQLAAPRTVDGVTSDEVRVIVLGPGSNELAEKVGQTFELSGSLKGFPGFDFSPPSLSLSVDSAEVSRLVGRKVRSPFS